MSLLIENVRIRAPERSSARALLIDGARIVALLPDGRDAPADATRIDCGGATIVPGFVDAHGHLLAFAASLLAVDCRGAGDIAAIVARIRARAAATPPGAWIRAFGYDEHDLAERRHPTRHDLDAAAPAHPVRLTHRGGHALVLNSAALAACAITTATEEPEGGNLDRELPGGEPSGVLFEMDARVDPHVPPLGEEHLARGVAAAEEMLLARGVTAFHDAGAANGPAEWRTLAALVREGRFRPRLVAMAGWDAFERGDDVRLAAPEIGGRHVKLMLSELDAEPHPPAAELARRVRAIHAAGLDVAVHAVTVAGVQAAATAIAGALDERPRPGHRHRIEHASICPPGLVAKLARHSITVVSQPSFIAVNGDRYLRTVGESDRAALYPFGEWERAGVPLAFGSDCPVAEPGPLAGIRAATTRITANGATLPGAPMTAAAALAAATSGAARAAGIEGDTGALRPGMRADAVVLAAPDDIAEAARVEATFVAGRLLYASDAFAARHGASLTPQL